MHEVTPTRAAAMELADERRLMRQGHELLDETRMLLASEMLRQLSDYESRLKAFQSSLRAAAQSLAAAVERHGLDNLEFYPAPTDPPAAPQIRRLRMLNVKLVHATIPENPGGRLPPAPDPSPEAKACQAQFAELTGLGIQLGAAAANLQRLMREYRRIERRAKALENVLIPEVEGIIKFVDDQLETAEREDTIRARWRATKPNY
jgi:V/A-type H+/Na+-transporting ATPase subunit D